MRIIVMHPNHVELVQVHFLLIEDSLAIRILLDGSLSMFWQRLYYTIHDYFAFAFLRSVIVAVLLDGWALLPVIGPEYFTGARKLSSCIFCGFP